MSSTRRTAWNGFVAAGPALLVLLAARVGGGPPGFLEAVADGVIRLLPAWLFDWGVKALGPGAKGLLFSAVCLGLPLIGIATALCLARLGIPGRRDPLISLVAATATPFVIGQLIVLPLVGAGAFATARPGDPASVHVPLALASLAYGLTLLALRDGPQPRVADPSRAIDRRTLLRRAAAIAGIGAWLSATATVVSRALPLPRTTITGAPDLPGAQGFGFQRAVQPVAEFYQVSKDWVALEVDAVDWRLRVTGMVEQPRDWTLDELRALPQHEAYRTLQCISAESITRTELIGNQRWQGVRVRDVLDRAHPASEARYIVWRCADGYHESLDLATARADDTWLVHEMGPPGTPLTAAHGYPLRLLVAGRYGMAQPKYLTHMVVVADDEPGWWVGAGWDTRAPVRTYCRIDLPAADGISDAVLAGTTFTAYGVASSGDRGISAVQVSIDGGVTWQDAELEPVGGPIGRLTWVRWRAHVTLRDPGTLLFLARAADGAGVWQEETVEEPFPRGASGLPRVPMRVHPSIRDAG